MAFEAAFEQGLSPADYGLKRAIVISLWTDARALPDDRLPDGETERRGWWGDLLPPDAAPEGRRWTAGSRLWLLSREKQLPETLRRAETYAREALAWMPVHGVARSVEVSAEWIGMGLLAIAVTIVRPDGTLFKDIFERQP